MTRVSSTDRALAVIYREAAELIASGGAHGWSCWAIEDALEVERHNEHCKNKHRAVRKYEAVFRPTHASWAHGWGSYWEMNERHDCRVLALCFMAAMVEAGDA